jgi:predicted nucleotidyltransferase
MIDRATIEDLARRIAEQFDVERIVLFGSYAYGTPDADSDVDLLVVMEHEGPAYRAAGRVRAALPGNVPIDVVVRSPRDLARAQASQSATHPAVAEAWDRGIELFRRAA